MKRVEQVFQGKALHYNIFVSYPSFKKIKSFIFFFLKQPLMQFCLRK